MRILITGGTGYIGTELSLRLMQRPEIKSIHIYDNLSRGNYNIFLGDDKLHKKVTFIKADILDSHTLAQEIQETDCVIHLAARVTTPFADQSPHLFDQINNWGTAELVYAFEKSESRRLIYMSSASIYGAANNEVDKNTRPNPKTFYGISKLKGEKHILRLKDKKEIAIVRCANVYGYSKSMRFDAVINKFTFQSRHSGRVKIIGSGEQYRAFIEINRVVDFLENLVFTKNIKPLYNLVDNNFSINEIADTLKKITPDLERIYVNQDQRMRQIKVAPDIDVADIIGSNNRSLKQELQDFYKKLA